MDGKTDTPDAVPVGPPATLIQTSTVALRPPIPGNHPDRDRTPIAATAPRTTGATGVGGDLESYVDRLEAQLDNEITGLNTTHDSDNDHNSQKSDSVDYDAVDTDNEENSTTNDNSPDDVIDGDAADTDNDNEKAVPDMTNGPTPTVVGGHALQRRLMRNYRHLKGHDGDGLLPTVTRLEEFGRGVQRHDSHLILQSVVMSQYSMKQGIKIFDDKGKQAVLTELQQLHDRDVGEPVDKKHNGK